MVVLRVHSERNTPLSDLKNGESTGTEQTATPEFVFGKPNGPLYTNSEKRDDLTADQKDRGQDHR